MRNVSQDSQFPGQNLNPGPPEYDAGELTTRPRRSVEICREDVNVNKLVHGRIKWRTLADSVMKLLIH
jgi:hypothetical protein